VIQLEYSAISIVRIALVDSVVVNVATALELDRGNDHRPVAGDALRDPVQGPDDVVSTCRNEERMRYVLIGLLVLLTKR